MRISPAIKNFLLDLLFPVECLGCTEAGTYLCAPCFAKLPIGDTFTCPVCALPSFENATCKRCKRHTALRGLIAASPYDVPLLRRAVFAYKYKFVRLLAQPLAHLALKALAAHDYSFFHRGDIVMVPVPLSARRERWRGFNQAQELAMVLAPLLSLPVAADALQRTRHTTPQVEAASREERFANIRGAFAVARPGAIRRKAVLLVDDVATTLATLSECARVLNDAGARDVWALVVAREHGT